MAEFAEKVDHPMKSLMSKQLPSTTTTLIHRAIVGAPDWWRDAVIYQVYPRSFADSNGDGIGDLPGVTAHLDHLVELGVDAIWLSPFYRSPQKDGGYDVADYREVDPLLGTLADVDALLAAAHEQGLRVLVDLVPNHTSSAHGWFQEALASAPGSAARDRYVFRTGRGELGEEPPNNWLSKFGGPAWTRVTEADDSPGEWYLHLFDSSQPDLNWENAQVHAEFEQVLRFWLDRGVDGFRIDVAHGLVKAPELPDWTGRTTTVTGRKRRPNLTDEGPMWDQDGVHEILRAWRQVVAEYPGDRALVAEAWVQPIERLARYVRPDETHQAFNFEFLKTRWSVPRYRAVITESLEANDSVGATTTWVLSNHDVVRHPSRLGLKNAGSFPAGIAATDEQPDEHRGLMRGRAASLLMLGLPGSAYLYQGEELGLPEATTLPAEARQDPTFLGTGGNEIGRDGCRVPLPWVADAPALGFSPSGASWLPQPASFARYALDTQLGVPGSTYEMYRAALHLRRVRRLGSGSLAWVVGLAGTRKKKVLAFINRDVMIVMNLGAAALPITPGCAVLITSRRLGIDAEDRQTIPRDTTVWLRFSS